MTRIAVLAATGLLLLGSACSGSSEPAATEAKATTAAKSVATTAASGASTTVAKAATAAASAPAAAPKSGGATDACALITADEVGRVMGATGVTAKGEPELAGATYCIYSAGGGPLVATSYLKAGVGAFNAFAASSQAQSGLGDRALWDAGSAALMILKGQTVLSITAGDGSMANERRLDLSRQLGAIGVARQ